MKEKDRSGSASVWSQFVEAKRHAFAEDGDEAAGGDPMTLEQLEAAIASAAEQSGVPETGMPPRATVHPSARVNITRWFYRVLVVLFAGLVAGLLWWGYHYTR